MTAHPVVEALALRCSKSSKEPLGCILLVNWHPLEVQDQYAYTLNTDSGTSCHSASFRPEIEGLSTILFCYEFVCTTSSGTLHATCRRTDRQKTGVWHCGSITLVFFFYIDNEDESPFRQKVQEVTQIFPTGCFPRNPSQHRRWTTRLPSRARHRPQR